MRKAHLPPPFLKSIRLLPERAGEGYPFDVPVLRARPFEIELTRAITFLVGENGTGKSTLMEAVAGQCGFNLGGGSRDNRYETHTPASALANALRLSWLPKVTNGFFLRAESFFNFATYLESTEPAAREPWKAYGGRPLHEVSHGESLLALFRHRLGSRQRALYLLDEPEAALSPNRQLVFLELLRRLELSEMAQLMIATHSPILLAYPGATLLSLDGGQVHEVSYEKTEHYRVTRSFLLEPDTHLAEIFERAEQAEDDAS
jgi:predicted ATPase